MSAATDFFENKVIDHNLRGVAYVVPTTIYLALFTTATTDAAGGTEVAGGSYARQACALDAAASGATANTAAESFTNMPACTVTHWALFDAVSAGNMLVHGAFTDSKTYTAGQTATIDAGDLDITVA